jgi:hypothetical protein
LRSINPVDALGSPTRKRGEWLYDLLQNKNGSENVLSNPKAVELAEKMDKVIPQKDESTP